MGTLSLNDYEDVRIWAPWGHIAGRWYGNRSERPILAIHGWLDNLGTFDTLIPLLPDYLGVLCIDLPGHGCSSRLPPGMHYSTMEYVLIIARVMKEYKWPKVSLMGHSLGGVLSYIYTALAPHRVDLVIALDILVPPFETPYALSYIGYSLDKHLVEDERAEEDSIHEPPSYTLAQLRTVLSKGSKNSVAPELAQHLLYRSVAKSQLYPERFYFSRDGRTKFYSILPVNAPLAAEMAKRIKNKPYLIIKGSKSNYINSKANEAISILRKQNPHFEYHEVPGTHHVHLVSPDLCAEYIVPFLRHHRPPAVSSWSLNGEEKKLSMKEQRRSQKNFLARQLKRLSKL
ncbi:serine hydrolase-like protein [Drosophila hydei]|uniref:Serine hydrolase-like protein n=1 Tax=Drosophila hydei TaxID=7224 RepID=A0A6J2SSB9_DROHY|nr:serine hydrolase-like protein [Drosophila hydei]XP_030079134.1 serine hydrolase-like protein [Drosophila hydei]